MLKLLLTVALACVCASQDISQLRLGDPRLNGQSINGMRLKLTDHWNAPVKIQQVLMEDRPLTAQTRLGALENWLEPLKVEAISESEKKITFVVFAVDFKSADEKASIPRYRFIAGQSILAMYPGLEREGLLDLQKGQRCTAIASKTWVAHQGIREAVARNQSEIVNAELFVVCGRHGLDVRDNDEAYSSRLFNIRGHHEPVKRSRDSLALADALALWVSRSGTREGWIG